MIINTAYNHISLFINTFPTTVVEFIHLVGITIGVLLSRTFKPKNIIEGKINPPDKKRTLAVIVFSTALLRAFNSLPYISTLINRLDPFTQSVLFGGISEMLVLSLLSPQTQRYIVRKILSKVDIDVKDDENKGGSTK